MSVAGACSDRIRCRRTDGNTTTVPLERRLWLVEKSANSSSPSEATAALSRTASRARSCAESALSPRRDASRSGPAAAAVMSWVSMPPSRSAGASRLACST